MNNGRFGTYECGLCRGSGGPSFPVENKSGGRRLCVCVCDVCMYKYIRIQIIREIISTEIQTERKIVTQDTTF